MDGVSPIRRAALDELDKSALIHTPSALDQEDPVGCLDRVQSMGDDDDCHLASHAIERLLEMRFLTPRPERWSARPEGGAVVCGPKLARCTFSVSGLPRYRSPFAPHGVSYPCGRAAMTSCAFASRQAVSISSLVASCSVRAPSARLNRTEPSNNVLSCGTSAMSSRQAILSARAMFLPSTSTWPELGS